MNEVSFTTLCILFLSSLVVGVVVFCMLFTELKLAAAITVSCLSLLLFLLLTNFKKVRMVSINEQSLRIRMIFPLVYSVSLIAIALIPSVNLQIVAWSHVMLVNYLRFGLSILVAFLFPGFAVIKVMCKEESLSLLESLVLSYMISLLITSLFGVNSTLLLVVNILLLLSSFLVAIKEKEAPSGFSRIANVNILEVSILLCMFLLYIFAVSSIFSDFWLFIGPDIWRHYGWSLNIMKGVPEITIVPRTFHILYAAFFKLSGLPSINAWILSIPVLFITVLSFYLMASAYLGKLDKRAPMISTIIWAFFSGFGWIYAVFLRVSSEMGWLEILRTALNVTHLDIGYPPGFWTFMGDNPPAAIGITALFLLLYLVRKNYSNNKLRFTLFTTTFIVAYMLHIVEAIFFFAIIPLLAILKDRINIKSLLLSIASACLLILSYDFLYQSLTFGTFIMTFTLRPALYIFFASSSGWILTSLFARKALQLNFMRFPQVLLKTKKYSLILPIILVCLIYLYGLSVFAWLEVNDTYAWWYSLPYKFISWYFYPILLGTAGLLCICGIAVSRALYKKYKDVFIFLLVSTAFFFLSGRLISYININYFDTRFRETRVLSFLSIPLAMLASISILYIFGKLISSRHDHRMFRKKVKAKKWLMIGILFVVVLTSGLLSTLMTVDYWTLHNRNHWNTISFAELLAMEYLRRNTTPASFGKNVADYELVFTPTDVSHQTLQAFSGTGTYLPYAYKGYVLFNAERAEQPLHFLNAYSTDFLFMTQRDEKYLESIPHSLLGQYMQFLRKPFENEEATIYEIPPVSPPLLNSETAIILPMQSSYPMSYNHAIFMFAKSLYNYTTVLDLDAGLLTKQVLVLPTDPRAPIPLFIDNSFTDGWNKDIEELISVSNGDILELSFDNKDERPQWVGFDRQLPSGVDTSVYRYLVWRVFIDDMVADYEELVDYAGIMLYDKDAKGWFWVGAVSITNPGFTKIRQGAWVDVTFDAQNNTWHQFGNISKMKIVLRVSPNSAQKIKTDYVALYKDMYVAYDPNLTFELLRWVENGGLLLVIKSDGLGDFSDILATKESSNSFTAKEITTNTTKISIPPTRVTPIFPVDPTTEILANYKAEETESPFALRKVIGKGEIIYLIAEPYIFSMQSTVDDNQRTELFNNMDSLLRLIDLPLPLHENLSTKKYEATIREANLQGYVTLDSNYVILPKDIELSELSVNSTGTPNIQFDNTDGILLRDIKAYGGVKWVITAQYVNLTSGGSGLYSRMLIGGEFETTLNLHPNSSIYMKIHNVRLGNATSYTFTDFGCIKFKIKAEYPVGVFVRAPKIFANGTTNLKAFYLEKKLYDYLGNSVTITGSVSFSTAYSDTFTLISDFKMEEGSRMEVLKAGRTWDEWGDVPWINILTSTEHAILIIVIITSIIFSSRKSREIKKSASSNK